MQLVKATELARAIGVSRRTMSNWCKRDPSLAIRKGREWYVKIDALAEKQGLDPVKARTFIRKKWIPAVLLAQKSGISRKTMANWCASRPNFAVRIGRNWYICLESLDITEAEADTLAKWVPDRHALEKMVRMMAKEAHLVGNTGISETA